MKKLILVRHAHRNTKAGRMLDNGLSVKGKKQLSSIKKFILKKLKVKKAVLYSSPKKRCIQTIKPLENKVKSKIIVLSSLNEGGNLSKKIRNFLSRAKNCKSDTVIVSTHGDWIPYFIARKLKRDILIKKGGIAVLSFKAGQFSLIKLE